MRRPPRLHRRLAALVAVSLLSTLVAGCREGSVRLTFRPEAGASYRYEVVVRTTTEVRLGDAEPELREEDVVLTAEHTVVRAGGSGVEVEVVLQEPGGPDRRFEVVFDRAAQLEEVQSIEGVPDDRLGTLGISEIFPAAAGAPPDRPLEPGASWVIDDVIQLPDGTDPTQLSGSGRLVELGVVGGVAVARLTSAARLPLESEMTTAGGTLRLSGTQITDYSATHDLQDGAVREATSSTVGNFDLEVGPPPGVGASPVTGTLRVEVSSQTRLIG
ncbi:MAG TPA: hypothetical protein VNT56_11665 [Acidimicrobiales bacterium]|nr:hypothetical protein [Acidimicrobiales bacterium]